jgi:hypothetical protein
MSFGELSEINKKNNQFNSNYSTEIKAEQLPIEFKNQLSSLVQVCESTIGKFKVYFRKFHLLFKFCLILISRMKMIN